jgi:hypothetical protein
VSSDHSRLRSDHRRAIPTLYGCFVVSRIGNGHRRSVDRGCTGRVWSREIIPPPGRRRRGDRRKATHPVSLSRDAGRSCAVEDPEHVRTHLAREPGEPWVARRGGHGGPRREVYGRTPTMNGPGQSDRPVVPTKSLNTGRPTGCGRDGGKGPGQGELGSAPHRPDTAPGFCAPGVGSGTRRPVGAPRQHPRQEPDAVVPLVRIRGGGGGQPSSLPRPDAVRPPPAVSPFDYRVRVHE